MRSDWNRPESWDLPGEGERRIMMFVSYDGSAYHGWQSQGDGMAVQDRLCSVLSGLGLEKSVFGSGRTDSGVHALSQGCHFDTSLDIAPEKYRAIFNTKLPKDIRVLSSSLAPDGFHARFSTQSREYWYLVKRECDMLPFDDKHITPVRRFPSLELLSSYAECIEGTHDFTTFACARDMSTSFFRDIYVSGWDIIKDPFGYDILRYRTAGNAFLYHQIRSMAGTMLQDGLKDNDTSVFRERLESRDRRNALKTAPADGLYLADVSYDASKYQWFEDKYGKQE